MPSNMGRPWPEGGVSPHAAPRRNGTREGAFIVRKGAGPFNRTRDVADPVSEAGAVIVCGGGRRHPHHNPFAHPTRSGSLFFIPVPFVSSVSWEGSPTLRPHSHHSGRAMRTLLFPTLAAGLL